MEKATRLALFHAIGLLACGTVIASCSQAPPEPAPEFILPISRVTPAPPSPAEPGETASAPSQLRYIAVPPGHNVAGMAHARIVVKHNKAMRHHRARKKAASPAAAVKTPTETAEPAAKR